MADALVRLDALFTIEHGNKFDFNKMDEADDMSNAVAFVNRSSSNNGVVGFVKPLTGVTPYAPGSLTVALGGSALASFVQLDPFYTAQNIDVLVPRLEMSDEIKLFYCLCIKANRFRYSTFGREANRTLKSLLVPDLSEVPSWVEGSTKRAIESLRKDLAHLDT